MEVSDGPGDYADDMECVWNITSVGPITIVFKAFSTEECCDFLTISDGTSGDLLGNFSGETLPKVLSTNATSLRVVFKSDSSSSSVGFELEAFALASALRALRPCLLHRLDVSENSLYAEAVAELCLSTSSAPLERWGRPALGMLSVAWFIHVALGM